MAFKKPNPEILRAVEVQNASDAPVPVTIVSGGGTGLTNAELRATPVPVSVTGGGDATAAKQDTGNASLASLDTKLGEVQASPTANTVLERLKALLTGIVLAAGSAIIGKVGIDQTTPGTTNKVSIGSDGTVELGATALAALETITVASVTAPLAAGTNNIGDVDVLSLPALPAGTNNIGDVDVLTLPALPAGTNNIGDVDVLTLPGVAGDVAHDAADSGNPLKIGGKAVSAEPAPVTANDRVNALFDLVGKQIIAPYTNPENIVSGTTAAMTGTTSTSLVAAPAAGLRNYLTTIIVSNAHASVGTDIVIQDGSGGTTLLTIPAAAVYGGAVITLPVPLRQPTTATAIFCANVTTGASTKVSAVGYKGV